MNRILIILVAILVLIACSKNPVEPESASIQLHFVNNKPGGLMIGLARTSNALAEESILKSLNKPIDLQAFDQARVMILDFSVYDSSAVYFNSEDYREYIQVRDSWPGDLTQWGEWEKLLGDYFRIISNQTLTIEGDIAKGSVAGAIGLNRVLVALIENGKIQHWAEGDATGKEGEVAHADFFWI